ncbi:hypothetical protein NSK_007110 [Nannochloropsis salina CCMP1776]|uniref:Aminotransferase class I/classII large domain-containing protein n=1 Tax=Nannochloropsis salina CCMP1776 TaxID=1027361 RepID=A0A4D9CWG2_9STRA|nr:hypothetical protein NSK_007110 [Nannochloropsis salina CCMP1776]|eukprot:TFJ81863.1 hypothetical protein NSK_007110 [Nannochloropsis salina CCMP1776]
MEAIFSSIGLRRFLHRPAGRAPKWSKETVNQDVLNASYAVRGPVLDLAMKMEERLRSGESLPFKEMIYCNIGNPQSLQQKPLTFVRQVLSLVTNPLLLEKHSDLFPSDAVARAQKYLGAHPMGAYSNSQGIKTVREEVAAFIGKRDQTFSPDPDAIFLINGASEGVRYGLQSLLRPRLAGYHDGVLVPIPQYPLYSALTTLLNGELVPYYLREEEGWTLEVGDLEEALKQARARGVTVRGLVVINPGNPTGQLLSRANMEKIIEFCVRENLVLMADEVYQTNIYVDDRGFLSFRKVAVDMGLPPDAGPEEQGMNEKHLQLVSFHSVSKGFMGECGLRGGYMELFGIPPGVKAQLYKLASISLCSNTIGQVVTGLMVHPPEEGSPSFPTYEGERTATLTSLRRRAQKLTAGLGNLEGVSVQPSTGAMYSFPRLSLPPAFHAEAVKQGTKADELYCIRLVEATGIVVVPGSGFGQVDGSWHFRTTFLPPEDKMDSVMERLGKFHKELLDAYRG